MNLARAAGLYEDVPEAALPQLVAEGVDFLRAGGVLSLAEWADLSPAEKSAMVEAGNVVAAERAAAIGIASQSPAAAARVAAVADGGESSRALSIGTVLERIAASRPNEPPVEATA